jgi:hypothetical protein
MLLLWCSRSSRNTLLILLRYKKYAKTHHLRTQEAQKSYHPYQQEDAENQEINLLFFLFRYNLYAFNFFIFSSYVYI